jgi:hypothetical protein
MDCKTTDAGLRGDRWGRVGKLSCATALLALLVACGGGGGGGDGGTPPPPPPPGGGGDTPAGTLWHNSLPSDGGGTKLSVFDTNVNSRVVDSNNGVQPAPNGQTYASWTYDGVKNSTVVAIKEAASGRELFVRSFAGRVANVRPSPATSGIVLISWASAPGAADREECIYDLRQPSSSNTYEVVGALDDAANWLPDGRYLVVLANGDLKAGAVSGTGAAAGKVAITGRTPQGLWVSPDGSKLLSEWGVASATRFQRDLWISNLDGSNLARFTNTNQSGHAVWSYDGKFIAWRSQETEVGCTGFSCASFPCEVFYASASSRGITLGDPAARQFRVRAVTGATTPILGCDVNGWTR